MIYFVNNVFMYPLLFFNPSLLLILQYSLGKYIFHSSSQNLSSIKMLRQNCNPLRSTSPTLFQGTQLLAIYVNVFPICTLMYKKFKEGNLPNYFRSYFKANSHIHSWSTKKSSSCSKTSYKQMSMFKHILELFLSFG